MKLMNKSNGQKGAASLAYIALGILITIGSIYMINRYQDRNHNITIHVPKVEVR